MLLTAPRWGRGGRVSGPFARVLAGDVVLRQQEIVLRALDHVEQVAHQRDLLDLLLDEPLEELLGAVVLQLAGELEAEFQRLGPGNVAAFMAEPVVGATELESPVVEETAETDKPTYPPWMR